MIVKLKYFLGLPDGDFAFGVINLNTNMSLAVNYYKFNQNMKEVRRHKSKTLSFFITLEHA